MNAPALRRAAERHWPVLAVAAVSAFLLFRDLGGPALWADEGDTAFYARTIRLTGLPRAWDGESFIESDAGARLDGSLLMVGTPWLPYYAAAVSTGLFGDTAWAERLPFALAALAGVVLLYFLVLAQTGERLEAGTAAFLLAANLQFVLYGRDARYPALALALSLWLAIETLRLKTPRSAWRWAAAAILLFLTHPLPALAGGCAAAAWVALRAPGKARAFAAAAGSAAVPCAAWTLFSARGLAGNIQWLGSLTALGPRSLQFLIECLPAAPLLAWAVLAGENRRATGSPLGGGARDRADLAAYLLLHAAFTAAGFLAVVSANTLYEYGLRYAPGLLAFGAAMTALLLGPLWRRHRAAGIAVLLALTATRLGGEAAFWLLPPVKPGAVWKGGTEQASAHEPPKPSDKLLQTDWPAFLADLGAPLSGTVASAASYLGSHARSRDILVTNYESDALNFQTGLRMGATVLPDHASARAAVERGLPRYVFTGMGASWLLWRWPWEGYQGYRFDAMARMLEQQGGSLQAEAAFPETVWENRPNRYFRRYSGAEMIYSDIEPRKFPPAQLYRVYWSKTSGL